MIKYAIVISMDLNVGLLDSTPVKDVEKITAHIVRTLVDKKMDCEVKNLGIKLLGKAEKFDG